MRGILTLAAALSISAAAFPAAAQETIDKRVGALESQLRAVQRKVFPGGDKRFFEPEFGPTETAPAAAPSGAPATSPLIDLTTRVDALERQLQSLTGQVEQATFQAKQATDALAKFRTDTEFRLGQLESGGVKSAEAVTPAAPLVDPAATPTRATPKPGGPKSSVAKPPLDETAGTTDAVAAALRPPATAKPTATATATPPTPKGPAGAEAAYQAAYALVMAKKYPEASEAFTKYAAAYPNSPKASDAQYWLGRSYMAQQMPREAAQAYLDNYRHLPKGKRAADSLLGLGGALMALPTPNAAKACDVYGELEDVYGATLTPDQQAQLKRGRTTAKCS